MQILKKTKYELDHNIFIYEKFYYYQYYPIKLHIEMLTSYESNMYNFLFNV